jgi:hypothetical protein
MKSNDPNVNANANLRGLIATTSQSVSPLPSFPPPNLGE